MQELSRAEVGPLISAFRDPSPAVRLAALRAVVRLPLFPDAWIEVGDYVRYLLQASPVGQSFDEQTLDGLPYGQVIEAAIFVPLWPLREHLYRLLESPDNDARSATALALARVRDPQAAPQLLRDLRQAHGDYRARLVERLSLIDVTRVYGKVKELFGQEQDPDTRFWLAICLAQAGETGGLEEVLQDLDAGKLDLRVTWGEPYVFSEKLLARGPFPDAVREWLQQVADATSGQVGQIAADLYRAGQLEEARQEEQPPARPPFDAELEQLAYEVVGLYEEQGALDGGLAQRSFRPEILPYLYPDLAARLVTDLFRDAYYRGDAAGIGNPIVEAIYEIRHTFEPDLAGLFDIYLTLWEDAHVEVMWALPWSLRWQIAWTVSRAGLSRLLAETERLLQADKEQKRLLAARLIEEASLYLNQDYPPLFGGGSAPADVVPPMLLFERAMASPDHAGNGGAWAEVQGPAAPRYLNALLEDKLGKRILDPDAPLPPQAVFRMRLDIGELSPDSTVEEPEPLPEHLLPKDIGLDVMVSSTDFEIGPTPSAIGESDVAHGHFFLPADGSPATTPDGGKYLYFYLATSTERQTARARIGLYYNNHLVQSMLLAATIGGNVGGHRFEVDFTLSKTLTDLGVLPSRSQVSIVTNDNGDGKHQIIVRTAVEAGSELGACTYGLDATAINGVVSDLRKKLRDRVAQATKKKRAKSQLIQDLRELAPLGLQLWDAAVGRCLAQLYPLLGDDENLNVVIQVSRPTTSNYTFPWGLIYDIPLNSNKKPSEFKICSLVDEWDDRQKMMESGSRHCPKAPNGHHERDTLCPFGFWGYRYPIEQLASTERPVLTIPIPVDSSFEMAVALTQYEVNLTALSTHIQSLHQLIQTQFPNANVLEGKDYESIRASLGRDLALVYFYCHGERRRPRDVNTYLGVGRRESITPTDFTGWVRDWILVDHRKVWDKIRPLIFINACHAVEINPDTLVSYVDAFIGTGHAAGIIGTEVSVKQPVAMEIATEFYKRFVQGHSVDQALHEIRLDYLAHGNLYGLIYTPYCWADLRIVRT